MDGPETVVTLWQLLLKRGRFPSPTETAVSEVYLGTAGIRADLLRNDGRGNFELGLEEGDSWEDLG